MVFPAFTSGGVKRGETPEMGAVYPRGTKTVEGDKVPEGRVVKGNEAVKGGEVPKAVGAFLSL